MKIDPKPFRVSGEERVKLKHLATRVEPFYESQQGYEEILTADVRELDALQRVLYASGSHSVVLIFQGMDAAGKDGAIRHVLTGVNPQGCEVYSFKRPSAEELEHDFLWRTTRRLPERGRIGVFNRSYYEEVLVVRVHPEILRGEGFSDSQLVQKDFWKERYRSIVNLERHLHRNGICVIKFFLHLSQDEQRKRFLERIDDPDKNWKLGKADIAERALWDQYAAAYEECLNATSTKSAPWHVVPADDKPNARLIVSRVVIDVLRGLKTKYPEATVQQRSDLQEIRKQLAK